MFCQARYGSKGFAKRLSTDDTILVRVYEDNLSKLGSRLVRANIGSTLNLKNKNWGNIGSTLNLKNKNWGNTPILDRTSKKDYQRLVILEL